MEKFVEEGKRGKRFFAMESEVLFHYVCHISEFMMVDFRSEIEYKISQIEDQVEIIRYEVFKQWGEYLFASNIDTPMELSKFQIAFLSCLTDKYELEIYPNIKPSVFNYFYEWYEEEFDDLIISFQGLNIKNVEEGSWEIMYEDDTVDPIVHVIFNGWEINYLSLTG